MGGERLDISVRNGQSTATPEHFASVDLQLAVDSNAIMRWALNLSIRNFRIFAAFLEYVLKQVLVEHPTNQAGARSGCPRAPIR